MTYHIPVLAQTAVDGLKINPNGVYVDVTYGGGGHSRLIFNKLTTGHLVGFDRDPDALPNLIQSDRFHFFPNNYRFTYNFLDFAKLLPADGILADLGVSSHQFDEAERGFSFRFDADLDLRMSKNSGKTAADILNSYTENQLIHIFSAYGEVKNSRTLAAKIILERTTKPILTTSDLVLAVEKFTPAHSRHKYLAQVFQALRIEVNAELDSLKEFLLQTPNMLKKGGRLVIISYHSLEDRLVKNFLKTGNLEGHETKDFYGNSQSPFKLITRKPIQADDLEIEKNNRARSARLRIAELI
ncbi:MAG: 16S rRNA (cytosine(1402)-N(4))-methyltransferase RsmH [Bacteroidales bacterium]|nr:16S rRNA (cytosine(1402)-N(4))-methyltransferase RsmH [Bacteroidales bacterium]